MQELELKAFAKINLSLNVKGRRADGYHEVAMVLQALALCDRIRLSVEEGEPEILLFCSLPELPCDERNLAYRAAAKLRERCGAGGRVRIELEKNVPMAAGLGGGSADAAAVLFGLAKLWDAPLSAEELLTLAAELGADVPFCLSAIAAAAQDKAFPQASVCALAEGLGERLTPLPSAAPLFPFAVLLKPAAGASTAEVYRAFDLLTEAPHPDAAAQGRAIAARDSAAMLAELQNDLEGVTLAQCPEAAALKAALAAADPSGGAARTLMSGSGPTLYRLCGSREEAERVHAALQDCAAERFISALL